MFNNFLGDGLMRPPLLLDLMNSKINYGKEEKTPIPNLADSFREFLFDFSYPLSNKISKQEFETQIINHFIMRRICSQTYLTFKMYFQNRILEIIPYYNKLFDSFTDWDIFNNGQVENESFTDTKTYSENDSGSNTTNNSNSTTTSANSTNTSDRRFSKNPQNELTNVKDGKYVTEYNFDSNNSQDSGTSSGTSQTTGSNTNNKSGQEQFTHTKNRTLSLNDKKMEMYKQFLEDKSKIMTLIYNDLEECFYQCELI